jgi:uncharacterized protein (DUF1499 family)
MILASKYGPNLFVRFYFIMLLLQLSALHVRALVPETPPTSSPPQHSSRSMVGKNGFLSRRGLIASLIGGFSVSVLSSPVKATETVGKDPDCNNGTCLGVWDGLLADCPHNKAFSGCVSSQDDTPGIFAEPWDYSESKSLDWNDQMKVLLPIIQLVSSRRKDAVRVLVQDGRYLRVLFTDGKTGEESVGEFYFTLDDTTVQFRVGSTAEGRGAGLLSSSRRIERCEEIRKQMGYLKLPVLRNRRSSLFFGESDFDTFGPGSAALGPPAEMTMSELEGR